MRGWRNTCATSGLEETFICETGDMLEIDARGARKAGRVTVGRICIDSGAVGEVVGDMVIRDRRLISEDGIVLPIIAINKHTGKMESVPEIVSRGFGLESDHGVHAVGARSGRRRR